MKHKVSVIIPAYNEEKLIGACLESLVLQNTKVPFQVVIADNKSTDKTLNVVEKYKKKLSIKIIKEAKKGRGAARFAGFKAADGEILLSTDADTIVPPNWIEDTVSLLIKENVVAIAGMGKLKGADFLTELLYVISEAVFVTFARLCYGYPFFVGFNFAVYNKVYKNSGGLNPDLNVNEDIDLAMKVSKIGKIVYSTSNPVTISARRFEKGFFHAIWSYLTVFIPFLVFRKKLVLPDIR
jgi:glycosyltransferase involved in cell wall biosynthesis